MVFDVVQLKDNEAFVQQIQFLVGVQQVVVLTATIVRFKHVQEIVYVKILFPDVLLFKLSAVIIPDKLVERVEVGRDAAVSLDTVDVRRYRTAQLTRFRFGDFVILAFPESQEQCLDAVLFLHVIDKM